MAPAAALPGTAGIVQPPPAPLLSGSSSTPQPPPGVAVLLPSAGLGFRAASAPRVRPWGLSPQRVREPAEQLQRPN